MQEFYCTFFNCKNGDKAEILLADNDSLMFTIEPENVYEDLHKDKKLFDFKILQ